MSKRLAWFLITILMVFIFVFWLFHLKSFFKTTPSLKEEQLFSLFKKSFEESKNVLEDIEEKIETSFVTSTTSTPESILPQVPFNNTTGVGEALTEEQIEALKDKILKEYEKKQN